MPATSVWRTSTAFDPSTGVKLEVQVVPPSIEYCTVAPVSTLLSASEPSLVILSVDELPVSWASATTGATGGVVSSVKVNAAEAGPVLPATSVWRTSTAFDPSTGVKLEVQVVPPSIEYCTVAPVSTLLSASEPSLVILSVDELPVSWASATPGATGGVVSSVKVKAAEAGPALPATSVWRTSSAFDPATGVKLEVQVVPPSIEYCTVAPVSTLLSASEPSLVILSVDELPVSWASATTGATGGVVSSTKLSS